MDRPHLRRRRNQNLTDKKAAGDDTHQSDSKTETESGWETLDFINDVNGGTYEEDSDMQLQEALFNSIQNMEFDFPAKTSLINDDVKKKGVDTSCRLVKTNGKRINHWKSSTREQGEPSCVYCTICSEPRPVVNDIMKRGGCGHIYCEECIISYARERIRENIMEVNCPVSDCKEVFAMNEYFVPRELMDQWRDAVCEARALASYDIIECPFGDCSGVELIGIWECSVRLTNCRGLMSVHCPY
ncbi:RING finger protein [Datura stramonium]|uniref:RING finger protein n=1 Tax=Datura stramonium TaxID=4076 RepID=A0ABS8WZP5_DATST|nr:RING finger protein [Datura stramonium]